MTTPRRTNIRRWRRAIAPAAFIFLGLLGARAAFAVTLQSSATITAGVMIGAPAPAPPPPPGPLRIAHTPLQAVSLTTKEVIIQGELGTSLSGFAPAYADRRTTATPPPADPDRKLRIKVRYRVVPPGGSLEPGVGGPFATLAPIDGPNPFGFALQIPPAAIISGTLQYQLLGSTLSATAPFVEQSTVTLPVSTMTVFSANAVSSASELIGPPGGMVRIFDGNPNVGDTTVSVPIGALPGLGSVAIVEVPLSGASSLGGGAPPTGSLPPGAALYQPTLDQPIRGPMQLSLRYPDFTYPNGQDGQVDGTQVHESQMSVIWWDGFTWRRLGGQVDPANNLITVRAGNFKFFAVVPAGPLSPTDRRPLEKIVTPNGDGVNDVAVFSMGDLTQNVRIEIFDITGDRVRTVSSLSSVGWDGRDDSGKIVESGVYIYQYEVDGQMISGLIAVAK